MSLRTITHLIIYSSIGLLSSHALVLRTFDATRHLRFLNFPDNPTHNTQFLHSSHDLTGVGWFIGNTQRQLTMVSPLHYVGANHVKIGVGSTIRFLSADGVLRDYTVTEETTIPNDAGAASDLFIGTLDRAITEGDNIRYYPYLNLSANNNYRAYLNQPLIILGRTVTGGSGISDKVTLVSSETTEPTINITSNYTVASGNNDDSYYQAGDSGSPVFISHAGNPAIVGTNSLVGSNTADDDDTEVVSFTNFANFIPHYVVDLNAVMIADGYHMTKAIPGSTNLLLNHTPPTTILRAGHSFNLHMALQNTQATVAENIRLTSSFEENTEINAISASPWFDQPFTESSTPSSRRAFIDSRTESDYSITLTIPQEGSYSYSITHSSDQSPPVIQNFNVNVIESFISWSAGLLDQTSSGDDDLDGISNLLEYAFGGNPQVSSLLTEEGSTLLLPQFSNNNSNQSISYIRRKDHVQRALSYSLTSSTDLSPGSFSDASTLISASSITSINDELEQITYSLTSSGTERFYRIEVSLDE